MACATDTGGGYQMVSWLCNLEATDDLVSRLEALADRHVEYNCLPSHCKVALRLYSRFWCATYNPIPESTIRHIDVVGSFSIG